MPDLSTTYLGLKLKNPLVASASPLTKQVDLVRRLEAAGAAAVVMHSLFEEQIAYEQHQLDHYLNRGAETYAEALTYFPDMSFDDLQSRRYIDQLERLKAAVDIPVIGSLNGVSAGGWIEWARKLQDAGADALELNIYYLPTNLELTGLELEATYLELVAQVRAAVSIPIALKLSPFFTALPNMALRFAGTGIDGLVLFNRFYQPDIDLETLTVVPNLRLSTSTDLRLPLRWIALLSGRIPVDFALSSGVHSAEDVLKAMMAGAKVAMMTSALLRNGVEHIGRVLADLESWMIEREYESIAQMRGSMRQDAVAEPAEFERANYMQALQSFDACLP